MIHFCLTLRLSDLTAVFAPITECALRNVLDVTIGADLDRLQEGEYSACMAQALRERNRIRDFGVGKGKEAEGRLKGARTKSSSCARKGPSGGSVDSIFYEVSLRLILMSVTTYIGGIWRYDTDDIRFHRAESTLMDSHNAQPCTCSRTDIYPMTPTQ